MNDERKNLIDLRLVDVYLDEIAMNIVEIVKILGPGVDEARINQIEEKISRLVENKLK